MTENITIMTENITTKRNQTMKSISLLILIAIFCTACHLGQDNPDTGIAITGPNSNFVVKMTSSMNAASSKPGDTVTAVVIDPVPLRGGRVEGTIDRADHSFLNFSFHTLHFEGRTYRLKSIITSVVSSKGNAGQDDLGQRIRIAGGGLIAYGTTTTVDEGAEIRFVAWEK